MAAAACERHAPGVLLTIEAVDLCQLFLANHQEVPIYSGRAGQEANHSTEFWREGA